MWWWWWSPADNSNSQHQQSRLCVLFMIFSKTIRAGYSGLRGPFIAGIGHQHTYTPDILTNIKYNLVKTQAKKAHNLCGPPIK